MKKKIEILIFSVFGEPPLFCGDYRQKMRALGRRILAPLRSLTVDARLRASATPARAASTGNPSIAQSALTGGAARPLPSTAARSGATLNPYRNKQNNRAVVKAPPQVTAVSNRVNDEITAPTVLLILNDGKSAGQVPLSKALAEAKAAGLDLVEIRSNVYPPVVRISDYGKMQAERTKTRETIVKRHVAVHASLKELIVTAGISSNDLQVKLRKGAAFLNDGHSVKVTVRLIKSYAIDPSERPAVAADILRSATDAFAKHGASDPAMDKTSLKELSKVFLPLSSSSSSSPSPSSPPKKA